MQRWNQADRIRRVMFAGVLAAAGTVAAAGVAASQAIESVYTPFNTKTCRHQRSQTPEDYGRWTCPGYAGLPIRVSAGDQRMQVSFGPGGKEDLASGETLPAFNNAYEGTVEWRLEPLPGGKKRPFATILRWNVVTEKDRANATGPIKATGRVLVVTRLGPGGTCHVGYVDAAANRDANALARQLADERARTFRCGIDKPGAIGRTEGGPLAGL